MKIFKKFISMMLAITMIVGMVTTPVSASTYIGSRDKKEGGVLGIGGTTYTYRAYYEATGIRYWPGKPLSYVAYHQKNTGDASLSVSKSQSLSFSTTVSYNNSIGGNVGIKELVSLSASQGYGTTAGVSFSSTSVKSYTKTITSSAKTGYYMLAPSQTEKRCSWKKYKNSNTVYTNKSGTYHMPYGNATVICLYSSNNSKWSIYR